MSGPKSPDDELLGRLRDLASQDAPEVVEQARSRARARAERLIEETLLAELLAAAAKAGRPQGPPVETEVEPTAPPAPESGDAWWTYCIMWDEDAVGVASGLEGVEPDTAVEVIGQGHLAALVSRVPLTEYGDERLREHLEDLEWVERTARRHEDVLEAAQRENTIVPLRLCSLYRDRDRVRGLLREHENAFREALGRVEGCVEWGVKVFADPRAHSTETVPDPPESASPGAGYLSRRRQERVLAEKASEVRARAVDVIHERFAGLSRASALNPPQRPELHGRELAMLLNGAYLVERNRRPELEDTMTGLQEDWAPLGFELELTGPWPPYNFVSGAAGVIS